MFEEASDEDLKQPSKSYKSVKGDLIDQAISKLINKHGFTLPIIRITQGRYLLGTESKAVLLKGNVCMVRVGGGFEKLEEYIGRSQDMECEKIRKIMREEAKKYRQVILEMLQKYGAE